MKNRITVEDAWDAIASSMPILKTAKRTLHDARDQRAAADIFSPISLPPFHNSAVDGYALSSLAHDFDVISTIGAGECYSQKLKPGQACRIMTGAKIPDGTKAVAMQEYVEVQGSKVQLLKTASENDHIRWAGEDVEKGQLVLKAGSRVTPAHIGLLAALGISEVEVTQIPTVAIVSTGNELIEPGQPLGDGQVYYCTGPMLKALAESAGARVLSVAKVGDELEAIVAALEKAKEADIIIMIGGMAGGLFDFGRTAFEKVGVTPVFFEGLWRPGKPLFFGTVEDKLVFGLPGNPVAAYVMFKIFIEQAMTRTKLDWKRAPLCAEKPKASPQSLFLRARKAGEALELVPGQGSHQLYNLSLANAIVWVPAGENVHNDFAYLSI